MVTKLSERKLKITFQGHKIIYVYLTCFKGESCKRCEHPVGRTDTSLYHGPTHFRQPHPRTVWYFRLQPEERVLDQGW